MIELTAKPFLGVYLGVHSFHDLMNHVGHKIECATYGDEGDAVNVALECMNCHEVLLDFDRPRSYHGLREQAKELLETWSKKTLVEAMLREMRCHELKQFIEDNT